MKTFQKYFMRNYHNRTEQRNRLLIEPQIWKGRYINEFRASM